MKLRGDLRKYWADSLSAIVLVGLVLSSAFSLAQSDSRSPESWWSPEVAQNLSQTGTNRQEILRALQTVPSEQRPALQFLVENMPARDLQSLSAAYLLENVRLAFAARGKAPWGRSLPEDLFLNDVLPYACVNERRDDSRRVLQEKCAPLVADCRTPTEAARRLNETIFGLVKVKYSTQRQRADQSPLESMSSGLASCTGLSILLVDACRSVAVPARLAGTPSWIDKRGNHTWVEIWDGRWHFVGAAEPDPNGVDRGWFVGDASRAIKDSRRNAIYAASFKKTGLLFPLVWAPFNEEVNAVNVTDRYTPQTPAADPDKARLLIKVLNHPNGNRVAVPVRVLDTTDSTLTFEGTSRDETSDTNDLLSFDISRNRRYQIEAQFGEKKVSQEFPGITNAQALVLLYPPETKPSPTDSTNAQIGSGPGALTDLEAKQLLGALLDFFGAHPEQQARWTFDPRLDSLMRQHESKVRPLAWDAYRQAPIHAAMQADFATNQVRFQQHLSPYTVKKVGQKPASGWPLFVAMHGGGNAPKELNDRQWRVMQRYYNDQPSVPGYLYVALRAPNDTWNGFYDTYVYPLVANLIRQFLVLGEVDPNKVFLMGYSHGGYGAFAIGPKMPDRFAAVHSSAAAPTDGETSAITLRNTPFTYMVGENDHDYGRVERCRSFEALIQKLRGGRSDIYPVAMELKTGFGHTGLPDRDKIKDLYPAVRNPVPRELTWEMTDSVIEDFFWLQVANPGKHQEITAQCRAQHLTITTTNVTAARVLLDSRLIDFSQPIRLEVNGQVSQLTIRPTLLAFCQSLQKRGDPDLAFSAEIPLPLPAPSAATNKR